jgi:DsbC/DsbD-like thiol-disulfide interchange protein
MKHALAIGIWLATAAALWADPVRDGPVEVELISEMLSIQPGQSCTLALRMKIDAPWHTYWTNPGDSGLPPGLSWSLPDGFSIASLPLPAPVPIPTPPFMTYGLEGEIWLLFTLTPPDNFAADAVTLSAEADWLICHEVCVPGYAELSVTLPVRSSTPQPDPKHSAGFASARARLPTPAHGWQFAAQRQAHLIQLVVSPPDDFTDTLASAYFFPYTADVIRHAAVQSWRQTATGYILDLIPSDPAAPPPDRLSGVLAISRNAESLALHIAAPFSGTSPSRLTTPQRNTP